MVKNIQTNIEGFPQHTNNLLSEVCAIKWILTISSRVKSTKKYVCNPVYVVLSDGLIYKEPSLIKLSLA